MRSNRDIAQLGYVELFTPTFEDSIRFFTEVLSMTLVEEEGESVCLRAWDDYERFTLRLTARSEAGIGRVGVRTVDEGALQRRVDEIESFGLGKGWVEGQPGRGPTYAFADPDGHDWEIYFESEKYIAPEGATPALKNQGQRRPNHGVGVRRLDHVNFLGADVEANRDFVVGILGAMPSEQIQLDSGAIAAIWMTFSSCAAPTSSSSTVCSSRPVPTNTLSSRPSSSTSGSRAATASRSSTPGPA
jgi:catechol 2,3-dioxygenase